MMTKGIVVFCFINTYYTYYLDLAFTGYISLVFEELGLLVSWIGTGLFIILVGAFFGVSFYFIYSDTDRHKGRENEPEPKKRLDVPFPEFRPPSQPPAPPGSPPAA